MKCNGRLGGFLSSSSRRNGCVCVHCLAHGNTICDGVLLCIFSLCIAPDDPSSPPSFIPTFSFSLLPHYLSYLFPRETRANVLREGGLWRTFWVSIVHSRQKYKKSSTKA